jgi:hypothetical protein
MMGNGIANVVAAAMIAGAILWTGSQNARNATPATDKEFAEALARAVGDIRNDVVVNCGCCGEGAARPKGARESF